MRSWSIPAPCRQPSRDRGRISVHEDDDRRTGARDTGGEAARGARTARVDPDRDVARGGLRDRRGHAPAGPARPRRRAARHSSSSGSWLRPSRSSSSAGLQPDAVRAHECLQRAGVGDHLPRALLVGGPSSGLASCTSSPSSMRRTSSGRARRAAPGVQQRARALAALYAPSLAEPSSRARRGVGAGFWGMSPSSGSAGTAGRPRRSSRAARPSRTRSPGLTPPQPADRRPRRPRAEAPGSSLIDIDDFKAVNTRTATWGPTELLARSPGPARRQRARRLRREDRRRRVRDPRPRPGRRRPRRARGPVRAGDRPRKAPRGPAGKRPLRQRRHLRHAGPTTGARWPISLPLPTRRCSRRQRRRPGRPRWSRRTRAEPT